MTTIQDIETKITTALDTTYLEVLDESHRHAGKSADVTHVKIIITSNEFNQKSLLNRHRAVYNCLESEMSRGLHAISIHAYTPEEWSHRDGTVAKSPACRGGSKAN